MLEWRRAGSSAASISAVILSRNNRALLNEIARKVASRTRHWWSASAALLHVVLTKSHFAQRRVPLLGASYLKSSNRRIRTVRPAVWEGTGDVQSPTPIPMGAPSFTFTSPITGNREQFSRWCPHFQASGERGRHL